MYSGLLWNNLRFGSFVCQQNYGPRLGRSFFSQDKIETNNIWQPLDVVYRFIPLHSSINTAFDDILLYNVYVLYIYILDYKTNIYKHDSSLFRVTLGIDITLTLWVQFPSKGNQYCNWSYYMVTWKIIPYPLLGHVLNGFLAIKPHSRWLWVK